MGVRDLNFWTREAEIWRQARKLEAFEVAILPHLEPAAVEEKVNAAEWHLYELENADEIEYQDQRAREKRDRDAKMRTRK